MLACVLFVQEWRIEFEMKREVGILCHPALCTLHPTPHNPLSPTPHTSHANPIAVRQSIRTWYNRGSWGARNE